MEKIICEGKLEPYISYNNKWNIQCIIKIYKKEYRFILTDERDMIYKFETRNEAQAEIDRIKRGMK